MEITMSNANQESALIELFIASGKAHHQAFLASNGEDAEWPIWYADYLREPLGQLLQVTFTRSQLIYCLMHIEFERQALLSSMPANVMAWPELYTNHFIEQFAATDKPSEDKLALYYSPYCPYCIFVRSAIDKLKLDVELRDISANRKHFDALVGERNRATVPVLKISAATGNNRWMPESRCIVQYLEKTYGESKD
jgi:glutaredoxin